MSEDKITIYEPNFTQIPNSVIAVMPQLSEAEFKVIMAICRKTFGYHKGKDRISLSQLQKLTGMSRASVSKAVQSEKLRSIVRVHETPKGNEFEPIVTPIRANRASSEFEPVEGKTAIRANGASSKSEPASKQVVQNLNHTSSESEPAASSKFKHTKENSTKENKQKKERARRVDPDGEDPYLSPAQTKGEDTARLFGVPVPEALRCVDGFAGAYREWWEYMRHDHNQHPSIWKVEKQFLKLTLLKTSGNNPLDVINQSIEHGSKSFYAIRDDGSRSSPAEVAFQSEGRPNAGAYNFS